MRSVHPPARTPRAAGRENGTSRAGIVGWLLLAALAVFVVASSMRLGAATCEVCMEYQGRSKCRTVGGKTVEEARRAAITNACAFISGGVTDSMACARQTPTSETCR